MARSVGTDVPRRKRTLTPVLGISLVSIVEKTHFHVRSLNVMEQMAWQMAPDAYAVVVKLLTIDLRVNGEIRKDLSVPRAGLDRRVRKVGAQHLDHRLL